MARAKVRFEEQQRRVFSSEKEARWELLEEDDVSRQSSAVPLHPSPLPHCENPSHVQQGDHHRHNAHHEHQSDKHQQNQPAEPSSPNSAIETPMSPERRGAPGHYTHTQHVDPRIYNNSIDRFHESTLPSLSPGGTLRSPGGREVKRNDKGMLSSPGGTVRADLVQSPRGTIRAGVMKDNWMEGGWHPLTREQLRKGGHAPQKERGAWFTSGVEDFEKDAESVNGIEKEQRRVSFVLRNRHDHHRLSTSHQQVIAIGHMDTLGLESDWGGLLGGHVTRQSLLRGLSVIITLADCVVLAYREAYRNPYHPVGYNASGKRGDASGESLYGWGGEGTADAYFNKAMVGWLVWDVLVSTFISAEISARHWHVIDKYMQKRQQDQDAVRAAREVAAAEKAATLGEEEDKQSAEELEAEIKDLESDLKVLNHEYNVKMLSTKPANLSQTILGRSVEDKAALAAKKSQINNCIQSLSAARQALEGLQKQERDCVHKEYVMTLKRREIEDTLHSKKQELTSAQRKSTVTSINNVTEFLNSPIRYSQKAQEQTLAIEKLKSEIFEIERNLEIWRELHGEPQWTAIGSRPSIDNSSASISAKGPDESEDHIASDKARHLHISEKRAREHNHFYHFFSAMDVLIVSISWLHLVIAPVGVPFTVRPLRLFRALYWVSVDLCINASRGVFYGLSVARGYVEASIILLFIYFLFTSTFIFTLYDNNGAHFRCILCPSPQNFCYDGNFRFNASHSLYPTYMVPEQWCHRGDLQMQEYTLPAQMYSKGTKMDTKTYADVEAAAGAGRASCPGPFECVDVREFVHFTPFHLNNYLGVNSVLYSVFALDGGVTTLITQLHRSMYAYKWLMYVVVVVFLFLAAFVGTTLLRVCVVHCLQLMWRRVPVVDTESAWFRIEGFTPWNPYRRRPKYLPPPVDYGPSLAAGNMSLISVLSSPARGAGKHKDFHNHDTVIIDPFSKVQPRITLRAICVKYCESRLCEAVTCLSVLLHFCIQATWHSNMTPEFSQFLVASEAVFQSIFLSEMCTKLYAAGGTSNFVSSLWRACELAVVLISFSAFAADICRCPGPTNLFVVALKSLVHLRILRIVVMETGMHFLCCRLVKGGSAAASVFLFASITLIAGAIIGKNAVGYLIHVWDEHDCHAVGGSMPCVLPFNYKGRQYTSCTSIDNDGKFWCATTSDFEKDRLWANCSCKLPRDSVDSLYVEEGVRASFETMGWALLTSFRILTGDDFSGIYSDVLAALDTMGGYTFLVGLGLIVWHSFLHVVLNGAFLAFAIEYFSFSSWQQHWQKKSFMLGMNTYVFETVFGEQGTFQNFVDPYVAKFLAKLIEVWRSLFHGRVQPEEEVVEAPLQSILSYGGESTPNIQSWWNNSVSGGSPVFAGQENPGASAFLFHVDHFLKPLEKPEDVESVKKPEAAKIGRKPAMSLKTAAGIAHALRAAGGVGEEAQIVKKPEAAKIGRKPAMSLKTAADITHALQAAGGIVEEAENLETPEAAKTGRKPARSFKTAADITHALQAAGGIVEQEMQPLEPTVLEQTKPKLSFKAPEKLNDDNIAPRKLGDTDSSAGPLQVTLGAGVSVDSQGNKSMWTGLKGFMRVVSGAGLLQSKPPSDTMPINGDENASEGSDSNALDEGDDQVGELRTVTRDSKHSRPVTRGSFDTKVSQSVAFSAYQDNVSEVRSHLSMDTHEHFLDSENSSPQSPRSPMTPPRKRVENTYVEEIYKDADLTLKRPTTSAHRLWSQNKSLPHRVLFCLTTEHKLRNGATEIGNHAYFKLFLQLTLVINFIVVASAPVGWGKVDASLRSKRIFFDFVTSVLVFEFLLKVMTYGLLMTPLAVLRSPVRLLELVIIFISLSDAGYVLGCCAKCFRILWLLGSLGDFVAKRSTYLRWLSYLVHGVLRATQPILWCFTLALLCACLFSIVGMRLAGGQFASCSDTSAVLYPEGRLECANTFMTSTGVLFPRAWNDAPFTFNDLPQSLVTLAIVSSMRWSSINNDLMDATAPDIQVQRLYRPEMAFFLAAFLTVVAFMLGNLNIAYVVNAIRDSESNESKRTRRYILFRQRILAWAPRKPLEKQVTETAKFSSVVLNTPGIAFFLELCNVIAIGMMLVEHNDHLPAELDNMLLLQRFLLTSLLGAELVLYAQAHGMRWLLCQPIHWANIFAVVGSFVWGSGKMIRGTILPGDSWIPSPGFRLSLLVFDKARYVRLVLVLYDWSFLCHWVQMQVVFTTLRFCIWRLVNFFFFACVILILFATIGMQLFSHVRAGEKLGHMTSLSTFSETVITLYYVLFGDDWQLLLIDCSVSYPDCTPSFELMPSGDCGSSGLALVYFTMVKFVFSNVLFGALVSAVLEAFQDATDVEEARVQNSDLSLLRDAWNNQSYYRTPTANTATDGATVLLQYVGGLLQDLPLPLRLLSEEQVRKFGRAYNQHPIVMRVLIELSIIAWCRENQKNGKGSLVPNCPHTRYPDIRQLSIFEIKHGETAAYFDLSMTLMHTVMPEIQSEQILVLRRPVLVVVEKVMAAIRISRWLKNMIVNRLLWGTLLDKVHQSVLHLREQEALKRDLLERETAQAKAEQARRLKRMMDEIYNIEAWVMKVCPQWETEELARRKRIENEEEAEIDEEEAISDQVYGWEPLRLESSSSSLGVPTLQRITSDGSQTEPKQMVKLLQKFKSKVDVIQTISRLKKGDTRTDSYYARCIYYQIRIPYGTQVWSPLKPSTSEHIEGHPYWQTCASCYRTIAVPMSPLDHPVSASMRAPAHSAKLESPETGLIKKKEKKKKYKGRSRFGQGAYTAAELCAVINSLICEDLGYFIENNKNIRFTHGLTEHVWNQVCSTLIQFCPPPEDHTFQGDSPTSPGAVKGQISLKIEWPGHLIGSEGLVEWGKKEDEAKNASVAVFCGEHSFYAMARQAKDGLFPPQANIMQYLGILKGNKPYLSAVLGNQNAVTLGGNNKLVNQKVPFADLDRSFTLRYTEVRDDEEVHELKVATSALYEAEKKAAGEYLMSFMGVYSDSRVEILALQILQAMAKRRLNRGRWLGASVTKGKLGETALVNLNILHFMSRPERRTMSIFYLQGGGTKTLSSPVPNKFALQFLEGASPDSPRIERELMERERKAIANTQRPASGSGAFKRGTTGASRKSAKDSMIEDLQELN